MDRSWTTWFKKIKWIVAWNNSLTYSDFNKTFKIYTDAGLFQLGAVVINRGKPIAFYRRKVTDTQQWYTLKDRELLRIVWTLKDFRNILFGHKLRIYTDNRKLTCKIFDTNRVLIWILILKEYGPYIEYIKGEKKK